MSALVAVALGGLASPILLPLLGLVYSALSMIPRFIFGLVVVRQMSYDSEFNEIVVNHIVAGSRWRVGPAQSAWSVHNLFVRSLGDKRWIIKELLSFTSTIYWYRRAPIARRYDIVKGAGAAGCCYYYIRGTVDWRALVAEAAAARPNKRPGKRYHVAYFPEGYLDGSTPATHRSENPPSPSSRTSTAATRIGSGSRSRWIPT